MFNHIEGLLGLSDRAMYLLKTPIVLKSQAVAVSPVFSTSQFIVALGSGLLIAFAFQFLLTNLSVALVATPGIIPDSDDESEGIGDTIRGIETKVGFFILFTVTIALSIATFLAVKLSMVTNTSLGAIVGITIWSAYFSLVVWLGSGAVGSTIGALIGTATSGLQGMMGAATAAIGANVAKNQVVSTAEDVTAAVRRELTAGLDPEGIQKTLQSSLGKLELPKLDFDQIGGQLEQLLKDADLKDIASSDLLKNVNRQTFVDLVSSRTDFSKQDVNKVAEQLEKSWQKFAKSGNVDDAQGQLTSLLKSIDPKDLGAEEVTDKLSKLVKQVSSQGSSDDSLTSQALRFGFTALLGKVLQNTDLSDLNVEKISGQLKNLQHELSGTVDQVGQQISGAKDEQFSVIKADLDNYLLTSPAWHLNRETVKQEFKDVIYDDKASPGKVRQQLESIDLNYFTNLLSQRTDFTPERSQELAQQLEEIRSAVYNTVKTAESESSSTESISAEDLQAQAKQKTQELRQKVEEYLRNTNKEELNPEGIQRDFQTLLEDPQAGVDVLKERFSQFDRDTLVQLLSQRQDLSEEQVNQTLDQIESVRDQVLDAPQQIADRAKEQYAQTTTKIGDYLRKTNLQELDPDGIQQDLATLFDDPKAGASALQERLGQVDRETLVKLLSQGDLSEEQFNQSIDKVQTAIGNIVKAPRRLASRVQKQAVDFEANLESYLRNTHKDELNPDGIKRDLQLLLEHPQAGLSNLGDRVSEFDRGTFVAILSQREDISEEEANQIADRVESTYKSIVEQFQKVQQAFQSAIDSVFAKIRDYLNSLDLPELNYEGIQQDFSQLFDDPQAGFDALRSRLGEFDRDTLVGVISSRDDISTADANKIVERIEATRDRVLQQAERIQQETQKRLKSIKHEAQKRAIATQKIAAGAAWWLFGTALTSLGASAAVGFIAVGKTVF